MALAAALINEQCELTSRVHRSMLQVAGVRPNAQFSCVLCKMQTVFMIKNSTNLFFVQSSLIERRFFIRCPLVSARSRLQRTAASWYPRRQGQSRSATAVLEFQAGISNKSRDCVNLLERTNSHPILASILPWRCFPVGTS